MSKQPVVYILASRRNGTLYIGVTSNIVKRVWVHKNDLVVGFTSRHGIHQLVYYEIHATMAEAVTRERQMKKWRRAWKVRLIEESNPDWTDLYSGLL